MKLISKRLVLQTVMLILVCAATGRAEDTAGPSNPDLQAKLQYCKTCHGLSGQGYRGSFPMPRLAGQQPEYLENQLQAFIERRRTNPVMFNVAHVLSPSMLTALATHFKELNPKPLGGAPRELVAAGKKIYEEGVPGVVEDGARFLASKKIAFTGADTTAYEKVPSLDLPCHVILLMENGIQIMEMVNLEELSREAVYTFLFIALPLKIKGGVGSPIRPIAIA